jgi:hypothetical protein
MNRSVQIILLIAASLYSAAAFAQEEPKPQASDAADVAKKLSNPVASLISMPFQNNMDVGIGDYNGSRNTLNIQPVIPVGLSPKLNMIVRVILPVISQHDITGENTQQSGLSDAVVSAFFSPAQPKNGLIWGAGPVLLVPTATDDFLATKKFGVGPTGLILKQSNGWTYGALFNQIWSVAGDEERPDVNQLFLQPFLVYNWKSGAGIGVNSEITQSWESDVTVAYLNPTLSGVTRVGKQIVSLAVGPRIVLAAPDGAAPDFGVRTVLTFVFPK